MLKKIVLAGLIPAMVAKPIMPRDMSADDMDLSDLGSEFEDAPTPAAPSAAPGPMDMLMRLVRKEAAPAAEASPEPTKAVKYDDCSCHDKCTKEEEEASAHFVLCMEKCVKACKEKQDAASSAAALKSSATPEAAPADPITGLLGGLMKRIGDAEGDGQVLQGPSASDIKDYMKGSRKPAVHAKSHGKSEPVKSTKDQKEEKAVSAMAAASSAAAASSSAAAASSATATPAPAAPEAPADPISGLLGGLAKRRGKISADCMASCQHKCEGADALGDETECRNVCEDQCAHDEYHRHVSDNELSSGRTGAIGPGTGSALPQGPAALSGGLERRHHFDAWYDQCLSQCAGKFQHSGAGLGVDQGEFACQQQCASGSIHAGPENEIEGGWHGQGRRDVKAGGAQCAEDCEYKCQHANAALGVTQCKNHCARQCAHAEFSGDHFPAAGAPEPKPQQEQEQEQEQKQPKAAPSDPISGLLGGIAKRGKHGFGSEGFAAGQEQDAGQFQHSGAGLGVDQGEFASEKGFAAGHASGSLPHKGFGGAAPEPKPQQEQEQAQEQEQPKAAPSDPISGLLGGIAKRGKHGFHSEGFAKGEQADAGKFQHSGAGLGVDTGEFASEKGFAAGHESGYGKIPHHSAAAPEPKPEASQPKAQAPSDPISGLLGGIAKRGEHGFHSEGFAKGEQADAGKFQHSGAGLGVDQGQFASEKGFAAGHESGFGKIPHHSAAAPEPKPEASQPKAQAPSDPISGLLGGIAKRHSHSHSDFEAGSEADAGKFQHSGAGLGVDQGQFASEKGFAAGHESVHHKRHSESGFEAGTQADAGKFQHSGAGLGVDQGQFASEKGFAAGHESIHHFPKRHFESGFEAGSEAEAGKFQHSGAGLGVDQGQFASEKGFAAGHESVHHFHKRHSESDFEAGSQADAGQFQHSGAGLGVDQGQFASEKGFAAGHESVHHVFPRHPYGKSYAECVKSHATEDQEADAALGEEQSSDSWEKQCRKVHGKKKAEEQKKPGKAEPVKALLKGIARRHFFASTSYDECVQACSGRFQHSGAGLGVDQGQFQCQQKCASEHRSGSGPVGPE